MDLFPNNIFNVANIVADVAQKFPNRIAVIESFLDQSSQKIKYKKYTYDQLSKDAESVAIGLRTNGIQELTRTICMTPPSYEATVVGLALQRVGATTLWIDPSVGFKNVAERLNKLKPEAFVGIPAAFIGRSIFGWGPRFSKKSIVINGWFPGALSLKSLSTQAPSTITNPKVKPSDPAAVLYTTGSTGPAKPTLYTHQQYSQLYRVVHYSWRFDPSASPPVDLAIFPAFFFIGISAGGTMVTPPIKFPKETPAKTSPKALLNVINDCKVQTCFASPIILENIAKYAVKNQIKTPSLKRIIGGGAPIYSFVKESLLQMMEKGGQVASNYGATEALPSTELEATEAISDTFKLTKNGKGLCVGRALLDVEIRIIPISKEPIPDISNTIFLSNNEIGEIIVRGQHISTSYFQDPESDYRNKIFDKNGIWHRLGDVGYLDTKNRLWVCGRTNQSVESDHSYIFPLIVEPIFDEHPLVLKSGLVSLKKNKQTIPVICVELIDKNKHQTKETCKSILELGQKNEASRLVKNIIIVNKLPTDPRHNSKIERTKLARYVNKNTSRIYSLYK